MRRAFLLLLLAACSTAGANAVTSTSSPPVTNATEEAGVATTNDADTMTDVVDAGPVPPRTVVATGETQPYLVATDGNSVYWSTPSAIRRAPANGGGTAETIATVSNPSAFVVDGDVVFYLAPIDQAVRKVAATGGTPIDLATGIGYGHGLSVHAGQVYFSSDDKVRRVSINGGAVELIADGAYGAAAVAVDDANVYWTSNSMGGGVSSGGPPVSFGGKLVRKPLAGGSGVEVDDAFTAFLAFDGHRLAWSSNVKLKTAVAGGPAADVLPAVAGLGASVGLDDQFIYYAAFTKVLRVPFAGGDSVEVARDISLGTMAVDARAIYLTDTQAGTILRLAKDGSAIEAPQPITACPTPVGDANEIAKSPRDDADAELLALSLHPQDLTAHTTDYERIVRDLAAIRADDPGVASIKFTSNQIEMTRRLEVRFSDRGGQAVLANEYSAWDCLDTFYGATPSSPSQGYDDVYASLQFKGRFNVDLLAAIYAKLPEITHVSAVPYPGIPEVRSPKLCVKDEGATWDYYLYSGGDMTFCPGPVFTTAAFRVDASGVVTESYHDDHPALTCPADPADAGTDAGALPTWAAGVCP